MYIIIQEKKTFQKNERTRRGIKNKKAHEQDRDGTLSKLTMHFPITSLHTCV